MSFYSGLLKKDVYTTSGGGGKLEPTKEFGWKKEYLCEGSRHFPIGILLSSQYRIGIMVKRRLTTTDLVSNP